MATLDGEYDVVTKTPMGEQKSTFTIVTSGDTFTGKNAGPMATLDVIDGKIDGNRLTWKSKMTSPMPMTLEGDATIDGDTLTGTMKMGAFGSGAMTGTRKT